MLQNINKDVWRQFGASIDMLENAIKLCPEELWDSDKKIWYMTYHCLFWLDYYLDLKPQEFLPPTPFNLSEFDASGAMPDRTYSKDELLAYLQHGREKCYNLVMGMTDAIANSRWVNHKKNYSVFEMLLYNMRHVQHHAAQLNLILRQEINDAPPWVSVADFNLKK